MLPINRRNCRPDQTTYIEDVYEEFRHEIGGIKPEEMDPNSGGDLTEGEALMGR